MDSPQRLGYGLAQQARLTVMVFSGFCTSRAEFVDGGQQVPFVPRHRAALESPPRARR